ncbi:hypothetical protein [Aeromicrobium fastidiosum]|uniref:Uncharacterized protein n=1 Tax=Aeromicrobium fastidiosum TaxID=52699 RepID=A0A641AQY3_9ACTN|nr:hypothetical protein [Aeromicrobium fastidiosum]KAA1380514.1 hypothetical protein ESP62_004880 [Aeromicrobium fastidiosum]MBP2390106.1 hypothetical protein [Aeromicrobium fastidiosum]
MNESQEPGSTPAQDGWALPGMEDVTGRPVTALEVAVRRTIARLQQLGYVEEMHAAHTAAAVELAQVISMKHSTGKASTIGNDMRAMIDLLDRLVPERDDSADLVIKKAMEQWEQQVEL